MTQASVAPTPVDVVIEVHHRAFDCSAFLRIDIDFLRETISVSDGVDPASFTGLDNLLEVLQNALAAPLADGLAFACLRDVQGLHELIIDTDAAPPAGVVLTEMYVLNVLEPESAQFDRWAVLQDGFIKCEGASFRTLTAEELFSEAVDLIKRGLQSSTEQPEPA